MSVQNILEKNTVGLTRNSSSSKLSSYQSENSLSWHEDKTNDRASLNKYYIKKSFLHSDVAQKALTIQRTRWI